jgi:hypothetical protein
MMRRRSLGELGSLRAGLGVGGDSSNTVFLDTETVTAHGHLEGALNSPVGTPRVTAPPEGGAVSLFTESKDRDLVVDERESHFLGVNTSSVELESVGDVDTARDGSVLEDLSLHLSDTLNGVMVSDVVSGGSHSSAAFLTIFSSSRWGRGAVTADVNGLKSRLQVVSNVLHARSVNETGLVSVRVDTTGVTTVARASSLSVDNHLGVDGDGGDGRELVQDVESVSDGRGRSLSPARSAVLRDVLVLAPGKVVDSVHVSPVDVGRNIFLLNFIPGVGSGLNSTFDIERGLLDTASLLGGLEERLFFHLTGIEVVSGLGEFVGNLVVGGIILLHLGSVVPGLPGFFLRGPGVLRSDPRAVFFDSEVVSSSADLGETLVSPVLSPRVSHEPVLLSILDTVADDGDGVNLLLVSSGITVDSLSGEGLKGVRDGDSTGNRSTLCDFLHHVLLSLDVTVLVSSINLVLVGDEASFSRVAVSADLHS